MSIQVDWEIVDEEGPDEESPPSPVAARPRRPRGLRFVLGGLVLLAVASAVAVYWVWWTYRMRLNQAAEPVRQVAQLEAQAVATNDRASFLALQDPDDPAWYTMQGKRFAKLEREGLPELGWTAMGAPPSPGNVDLEPGGARVDMTYHFSVTQPMPGGPVSITLRVPQFYKPTPSGWVRAMPGADYWGPLHTQSGKRFALWSAQRDASLLGPLIPRMDKLLEGVCNRLPCPSQPILVIFENSPGAMTRLTDPSMGFDDHAFTLRLPSPQLFGVPADARARDELYRMVGTRVIQAVVYEATGHLNVRDLSSQTLVRLELAQAGLTGPFITPALTSTLVNLIQAGALQHPLEAISLNPRSAGVDAAPDEVMMPLAFAFIEKQLGHGSVARLAPAMRTSVTLGDAIRATLGVDPTSLDPAWRRYLQEQAGLLRPSGTALPGGELALWCTRQATGAAGSSIWRVHADGTGMAQATPDDQKAWPPHWSPDGKLLAYAASDHESARVWVMDADSQAIETVAVNPRGLPLVGWLPDGRLQVTGADGVHLVSLGAGEQAVITGTHHAWSPDGTWLAYLDPYYPIPSLWIASADGRNARPVAPGYRPVWSPDGKRLAFLGDSHFDLSVPTQRFYAREIRIADAASGSVTTLARGDDLLPLQTDNASDSASMDDLAWSPDGSFLAVTMAWPSGSAVLVISADTGAARERWQWAWAGIGSSYRTWSPDSRHVAVWIITDSSAPNALGILDIQTGEQVSLPGKGFDWSPDSKWLAVIQDPTGVLLVTPDLSAMRWLDTSACFDVAWRPGR